MINKIKINLSKNIISSWKIKKYDEPLNNYYIICICFFIKYEGYKDDYLEGLIDLINRFRIVLPNYRLRIYHDNTVLNIINNILDKINNEDIINNIELYEYDIEIFREEKNKFYHKGTIGTIIRFLPLFNLEYHKVDKCIILDIDGKLSYKNLKSIKYMDDNNTKFGYQSRLCYKLYDRMLCINKNNNISSVIASFLYQSISLPYKILGNYLEKLYIKKNKKIINLIINKCKMLSIYEYGIDEFFLNKYYIKYFYKNKIEIMVILNRSNILSGFNNILNISKEKYLIMDFLMNFLKIVELDHGNNIISMEKLYSDNENEKHILNSFKDKDIRDNVIILINKYKEINENNKKIKYFDILLNCILNTIKYMNGNFKINLLKINTNYLNKKFIIDNLVHIKLN